jgi:hypothetical protein
VIHSPELDQLASALAAAQAEFTAIPKGSENPFFQSRYAGLPAVVASASPVLAKHGLAVSQLMGYQDSMDGGYDTLTIWVLHQSGQFIAETMRLRPVGKTDKDGNRLPPDPQAQGSATTYARRYSYMGALGLVADQDDDGNRGSGKGSVPVDDAHPMGPEYDKPVIGAVTGAACVQLCGGDKQKGIALFKIVRDDCGGYMPQAAALALIHAADTTNVVPDVTPDPESDMG